MMFPPFVRSVFSYLGWSIIAIGAFLLLLIAAQGCGDDWPRAVKVGVTVGHDASGTACVVVDGGIQRVDCDGGTQ